MIEFLQKLFEGNTRLVVGTWVKAKSNECIRYVTRHINEDWFEDDGKESGLAPPNRCYYENYEKI